MFQKRNAPETEDDHGPGWPYRVHVGNADDTAESRFGTFLASARKAKGLSREEFAELMGWADAKKVWRLETGRTQTVDITDVIQMARALDVPPTQILAVVDPDADNYQPPPPLPAELARLAALYSRLDAADQGEMLDWVAKINDLYELRVQQTAGAPRFKQPRRRTG